MPSALLTAEVAVGAALVVAAVLLVLTFVRRRVIGNGRALTLCGLRAGSDDRWRVGLMRQGSSRLEWFTLIGVSTRPRRSWERAGLDIDAPGALRRVDHLELIPDAVLVHCGHADEEFELALPTPAYTALRSWAEAAPPGSTAPVT